LISSRVPVNLPQFMVVSLMMGSFVYAALFGVRHRRYTEVLKKPDEAGLRKISSVWVLVFLAVIIGIHIIYLRPQLQYFISATGGRLPELSYAEYARRGFLEICAASLGDMALIAVAMTFTRYSKKIPEKLIKIIVAALSVLALALLATAFAKMLLYMQSFGLTSNRIVTSWFMLGLALTFVFVIIRCVRPTFKLVRAATVTAFAMFFVLCFVDCDYIAANYNRDAYIHGRIESFDVEMLAGYSDSVIPVVIDLYENGSGDLKAAAGELLTNYAQNYDDGFMNWRSFNITRDNAYEEFVSWKMR
jgi:hypothetical protein